MPAPNGQAGMPSAVDVWSTFSQTMDTRPEDAWKILASAPPDVIKSKILFMEG
jgi:hypothetical protein